MGATGRNRCIFVVELWNHDIFIPWYWDENCIMGFYELYWDEMEPWHTMTHDGICMYAMIMDSWIHIYHQQKPQFCQHIYHTWIRHGWWKEKMSVRVRFNIGPEYQILSHSTLSVKIQYSHPILSLHRCCYPWLVPRVLIYPTISHFIYIHLSIFIPSYPYYG